ncbi:FKBP-type peptidyl-prolyl cis-trans isomerase [Patescibacteria group bacterium]|nr:FKBP-type peptidyl-prolyl cis-trans isomerase [Patescibacteria group bacterium]
MKNNLPVIIAALVIVVLLVLIFVFSGKKPSPNGASAPAGSNESSVATVNTQAATSSPAEPANRTATTADGLQITDVSVGTGAVAQAGDTVTVSYVGSFPNGQVFDASANHGGSFSFVLGVGHVIPGWDEGVLGMRVGGERKLVVPPALGYGASGTPDGTIPPNATLDFDIKLLGVSKAQ